ncbi:hypothetical protein CXG81DRAFT_9815 [Caulochytrium protostelioides]|uniref:Ribosomal protein S8 n=1 Tax=Caulochytrium protostelioides TaxID=1555241 RepID=A0A4P9XDQ8_9FUNG|nr:hypothetical protein CXG81DRAFT_9815 [Caulochytrium protostelioides]|eukprot:RKP03271.1 hypothetical protein CXG81DRAFT_9815 [Caulochytrium protostelioides]
MASRAVYPGRIGPTVQNLCSQLQNASRRYAKVTAVPETKTNRAVCEVLRDEGLIAGIQSGDTYGPFADGQDVPITPDNVAYRKLWLTLKYREGEAVLSRLKVVSKPSRRVYATVDELQTVAAARHATHLVKAVNLGQVSILRTPFGVVELKDALRQGTGGEVLCVAS